MAGPQKMVSSIQYKDKNWYARFGSSYRYLLGRYRRSRILDIYRKINNRKLTLAGENKAPSVDIRNFERDAQFNWKGVQVQM